MSSSIEVILSSPPDRDHLVAELFHQEEGWAIVSPEGERLILEIYSCPSSPSLKLPLDHVIESLRQAKWMLLGTTTEPNE